jgi:hypothetical protein
MVTGDLARYITCIVILVLKYSYKSLPTRDSDPDPEHPTPVFQSWTSSSASILLALVGTD